MAEQEAVIDFCNALEAACVNLRIKLGDKPGGPAVVAVTETTFNILKFDAMQGEKLGNYEIAYQANNTGDKFQQAYNILEKNNATIKNRYHGADYAYSYWIYGEGKIYRQKLKPKQ